MAPIPFKQGPGSSALVREAVTRATLATSAPAAEQIQGAEVRFGPPVKILAGDATSAKGEKEKGLDLDFGSVLCWEEVNGRRCRYVVDSEKNARGARSVKLVSTDNPPPPIEEVVSFIRSFVVPEGFPDSVTPSFVPYMSWRALKHFFGGAMGVLTTQTLLRSVGVCQNRSASGAVAINWILKDGAGRLGKMIFARQGRKFDYDLKQLRFSSDLLLELGAGIELATSAAPQLFLPMACLANVIKNVAVVTSTSTRTPIYKSYARAENIGDVTAKGECVGNLADLMGTGLSIMISKHNPSMAAAFSIFSFGYLFSSYKEVKNVVLNTLNRARFNVAVDSFIKTGYVPSLKEGNFKENIFSPPWERRTSVDLGSRFGDAFQEPSSFLTIKPLFESERYMVTYNPSKDKIYALLKDQAKSDDILKAAYHAHVLLHYINSTKQKSTDFTAQIAESCRVVSSSYGAFKHKAKEQGWIISDALLNPGRARFCAYKEQ